MIKVTKGKVKFNGEFFGVGAVISGLSQDGEARLVKKGVAEYVQELEQKPEVEPKKDTVADQETATEEDAEEEGQEEQAEIEEPEEAVTEPTDAEIDFNPDDCIVTEEKPKPAPKKPASTASTKKSGKK